MAYMNPRDIPADRSHLDPEDRDQLLRFELLVAQGRFDEAQDTVESLWLEATDAHKALFKALANIMTAVCARTLQQRRGAAEIARRSHAMLEPFPRRALGFDLDALASSVDDFVLRGEGPVLLLRQG
jgi:hypothetical protein